MYGFIYITTNNINGKKYIGKKKYDKRGYWKLYLGSGVILGKAIKKYGRDNFSKEIIEECDTQDMLNVKEKYWINYYDAVNSINYYNIASGGDGGDVISGYTEEEKRKIYDHRFDNISINQGGNNPNAKQVICLNTMEIFCTTVEAARYGNTSDTMIQSCCHRRNHTHTAGCHPLTKERLQWEYYNKNKEYTFIPYQRDYNSISRNVKCINTGKIFNSVKDAAKYANVSDGGIRFCCQGKYKTSGTHPVTKEKLYWEYVS